MKRIMVLLITLMCSLMIPFTAYADTGPKPYVTVNFSGLHNMTYYVTLLSKTESSGHFHTYSLDPSVWKSDDEDYDIFNKFLSYKDSNGYYFLQFFKKCSNNSSFNWTYYPPDNFKILIYFPEIDTFAVSSESYDRYAFHSHYRVDCSNLKITSSKEPLIITAEIGYSYSKEIISLAVRTIITILIELAIALIFQYRAKLHIIAITLTNIFTQTILNILLNIINYKSGKNAFVINYVFLEMLVFFIEAVVYTAVFTRWERNRDMYKGKPALYAFAANAVSFIAGMWIAHIIPQFF